MFSSGEKRGNHPRSCNADSEKGIPRIEEAYERKPEGICRLLKRDIAENVADYPLRYSREVCPRKISQNERHEKKQVGYAEPFLGV
jgi:hypothetical protein